MLDFILLIIAYFLGSIPTAVWIGKRFYELDVREHGSGNAGATNTFRVLGTKAGIIVLLIDVSKGFLAVSLLVLSGGELSVFVDKTLFQILLGTMAVIGHILPLFAQFKGGKGIATLLGVTLGVLPGPTGVLLLVFLLVFISTRYVSLASIIAAMCYPFILIFLFKTNSTILVSYACFITIIVFVTHRNNVKRLIKGEENRMSFQRK